MKNIKEFWNWIKPRLKDLLGLLIALVVLLIAAIVFTSLGVIGILYTIIKHCFIKRDYSLSRQFTPIVDSVTLLFDGFANAASGEMLNDALKIEQGSKIRYGKWYHTISAVTGLIKIKIRNTYFREFINGIFFWQKDHCEESITPEQRDYYLED